jgi:hypothetical protein
MLENRAIMGVNHNSVDSRTRCLLTAAPGDTRQAPFADAAAREDESGGPAEHGPAQGEIDQEDRQRVFPPARFGFDCRSLIDR